MQDNGWGIPAAHVGDPDRRDALESALILDTLEEEVIPLYYERSTDGYSREWVMRAKRAMSTVIPRFSMGRMLRDYSRNLYRTADLQYRRLAAEDFAGARQLSEWAQRVHQAWSRVSVRMLTDTATELTRGEWLRLRVAVNLNGLAPQDVRVEFVARRLLPAANLEPPPLCSYGESEREGLWKAQFRHTGEWEGDGAAVFALDAEPPGCGQFSTEVRIHPWHEMLTHEHGLGLMKWL